MASPEAEAVKAQMIELREQILDGEPTLEEQREGGAMILEMASEPTDVTWTDVDAGGVPAVWADSSGGDTSRVILYVHGGGYVIGTAAYYRRMVGHLSKAVGCRVLNVDYRLAPEHPHPAAVEDATAAYRWLLSEGYEPAHIAISGDSAGGGLTVATLVALRDAGVPLPAAGVPISPWIDLEGTGESMTSKADVDLLVNQEALKLMSDMFLAGQDPRDPLAAPLHADLTGLSPLYIQVGEDETLLDDATRLASKAEAAGVDTQLEIFPEMQHVFQMCVGNVPEATEAVAKIADYLRPRLGL